MTNLCSKSCFSRPTPKRPAVRGPRRTDPSYCRCAGGRTHAPQYSQADSPEPEVWQAARARRRPSSRRRFRSECRTRVWALPPRSDRTRAGGPNTRRVGSVRPELVRAVRLRPGVQASSAQGAPSALGESYTLRHFPSEHSRKSPRGKSTARNCSRRQPTRKLAVDFRGRSAGGSPGAMGRARTMARRFYTLAASRGRRSTAAVRARAPARHSRGAATAADAAARPHRAVRRPDTRRRGFNNGGWAVRGGGCKRGMAAAWMRRARCAEPAHANTHRAGRHRRSATLRVASASSVREAAEKRQ